MADDADADDDEAFLLLVFVDVDAFGWRDDDDNGGSVGGRSPGGRRLDRYGWRNGYACQ